MDILLGQTYTKTLKATNTSKLNGMLVAATLTINLQGALSEGSVVVSPATLTEQFGPGETKSFQYKVSAPASSTSSGGTMRVTASGPDGKQIGPFTEAIYAMKLVAPPVLISVGSNYYLLHPLDDVPSGATVLSDQSLVDFYAAHPNYVLPYYWDTIPAPGADRVIVFSNGMLAVIRAGEPMPTVSSPTLWPNQTPAGVQSLIDSQIEQWGVGLLYWWDYVNSNGTVWNYKTSASVVPPYTGTPTNPVPVFTVNASITGGQGALSPASQNISSGGKAAINISPNSGYKIASITDNGSQVTVTNPYVIPSVTVAHTVVVAFSSISGIEPTPSPPPVPTAAAQLILGDDNVTPLDLEADFDGSSWSVDVKAAGTWYDFDRGTEPAVAVDTVIDLVFYWANADVRSLRGHMTASLMGPDGTIVQLPAYAGQDRVCAPGTGGYVAFGPILLGMAGIWKINRVLTLSLA